VNEVIIKKISQVYNKCFDFVWFQGYRVLPDAETSSQSHSGSQRPWYCSDTAEKAMVGINRIWVYSKARRKHIASKLLDCVRYGLELLCAGYSGCHLLLSSLWHSS